MARRSRRGQICQIRTLTAQHVEREQYRGHLLRGPVRIAPTDAKPLLECAEVRTAVGVGDDNLTVDHGVQRERIRRTHELRERDAEVLQVPAKDPRRASVGSPQQTAEAIELWFVAPLGSARQGGFQPRQHRQGHASNHDAGMYFAGHHAGDRSPAMRACSS